MAGVGGREMRRGVVEGRGQIITTSGVLSGLHYRLKSHKIPLGGGGGSGGGG